MWRCSSADSRFELGNIRGFPRMSGCFWIGIFSLRPSLPPDEAPSSLRFHYQFLVTRYCMEDQMRERIDEGPCWDEIPNSHLSLAGQFTVDDTADESLPGVDFRHPTHQSLKPDEASAAALSDRRSRFTSKWTSPLCSR